MTGRVLIVQPGENEIATLARIVEEIGCKVFVARNQKEVYKILYDEVINLLVISTVLSSGSAFDVCKNVRREKETKKIPIIVTSPIFTATLQIEVLSKWQADEFVTLPASVKFLQNVIRYYLGELKEKPKPTIAMKMSLERSIAPRLGKPVGQPKSKISMAGDLSDVRLDRIITILAATRRSGELMVKNKDIYRIIEKDGQLVQVSTPYIPELSLGTLLVKHGLIEEADLAPFTRRVEQEKALLGQMLMESGTLKKQQIAEMLNRQFIEKALMILSMKTGKYKFKKGAPKSNPDFPVEIPLVRLLMENCRQKVTTAKFEKLYGDKMKLRVRYRHSQTFSLEDMGLEQHLAEFLRRQKGKRNLQELILSGKADELQMMAAIHCMFKLKLLKFTESTN